ncbi:MAG TPA: malate/lactate/ureidoglycolate dehydrogenase [Casimicrobiaceae bacterium]|nr:malate/lactate/ureidoglycolate dehydrogenase [Casimicrobiaceae bacterium]
MSDEHVFRADSLERAISAVIAAAGSQEHEATHVARSLVESNLRGHDSHGIGMVPRYIDAVLDGSLKPNGTVRVTLDAGPLLVLDGQRAYGQVVGDAAMEHAIGRARALGTCVMALARAHHLGRIGQFAEIAAAQGLVSLHFVNVISLPRVAPWGGADARYGTNPCCIGIPVPGEPPMLLDFATSAVAQGKLRVAYNKGKQVAPGLVIDDKGRPTTDPRYAVVEPHGAMMPFGEHKGYGLAVACELLGGALTGSGTEDGADRADNGVINGMLTIVIDPARLGTRDAFGDETAKFLAWLRGSPVAPGFDRVRIAGEPERESKAQRLASGIPVDTTTWKAIGSAAEKVGLARSRVDALATA